MPVPPLAELTDDALRAEIDTKVLGYLRCARAVAPLMAAQGWGRIVNISGLNARMSGSLVGSIRNVAVAAMTKNLADELGPRGIRVTVVHPGTTRHRADAAVLAGPRRAPGGLPRRGGGPPGGGDQHRPAGRPRAEVADVVVFLASPSSVAMTGDAIAAGGGTRGTIHY